MKPVFQRLPETTLDVRFAEWLSFRAAVSLCGRSAERAFQGRNHAVLFSLVQSEIERDR